MNRAVSGAAQDPAEFPKVSKTSAFFGAVGNSTQRPSRPVALTTITVGSGFSTRQTAQPEYTA